MQLSISVSARAASKLNACRRVTVYFNEAVKSCVLVSRCRVCVSVEVWNVLSYFGVTLSKSVLVPVRWCEDARMQRLTMIVLVSLYSPCLNVEGLTHVCRGAYQLCGHHDASLYRLLAKVSLQVYQTAHSKLQLYM